MAGSILLYDPVFTDDFTGTDDDAPNATKWPTVTVDPNNSSGTCDIQGNELNMTTPAVTGAYVSMVAQSTTETGEGELLFKFAGARANTGNQWLYACLGSSGEVQDSADGRPASAYYLRIDTGSGETGGNDKIYRRASNTETEMIDGGNSGNIQIIKKSISRPSTGDFWVRIRLETDELGTVIFKGSQWGVAGTEPSHWQFVIVDDNPATIAGGGLQFVTRNYNNTTGSDNSIDDVEYWDTSDNDHWEQYFDGTDGNSIVTSNWGPDYLDATVTTGGTLEYDDDQLDAIVTSSGCGLIKHGTGSGDVGVRLYKGDGSVDADFLETTNVYSSCYFYRDAALGDDHDILTIDNPSNGAEVSARYINSDSTLRLVVDGSVSGTFTTTFPADELIRIDLHADDVGSSSGTAEMRVFTGSDVHKDSTQGNATEYKTATGATLNAGAGLRGSSVGMFGTSSTTAASLWVDALVVSTKEWPAARAEGDSTQTITPGLLDLNVAPDAPTIVDDKLITPAVIDASPTFYEPSLGIQQVIAPDTIIEVSLAYAPVVQAEGYYVTMKTYNGATWDEIAAGAYNGATWSTGTIKHWDGSEWIS